MLHVVYQLRQVVLDYGVEWNEKRASLTRWGNFKLHADADIVAGCQITDHVLVSGDRRDEVTTTQRVGNAMSH